MKALALVVLAGCNWVLDLAPTTEVKPPSLIVPPDGPTSCPPAPDFSTWTFAPHTLPGFTQPIAFPRFVAADRVIFASQGELFESGLDGGATPITSLDLPDSSVLIEPSPVPGGDLFWFVRAGGSEAGTYYAVRDGAGWAAHRADFSVTSTNLELGGAAFHAGSIRMPVRRSEPTPPFIIELESFDGTTWTSLQPLDREHSDTPTFSSDGCLIVYLYSPGGAGAQNVALAARNADGTFGPGIVLPQLNMLLESAAIDPTYRRIWVVDHQQTLYEGLAP